MKKILIEQELKKFRINNKKNLLKVKNYKLLSISEYVEKFLDYIYSDYECKKDWITSNFKFTDVILLHENKIKITKLNFDKIPKFEKKYFLEKSHEIYNSIDEEVIIPYNNTLNLNQAKKNIFLKKLIPDNYSRKEYLNIIYSLTDKAMQLFTDKNTYGCFLTLTGLKDNFEFITGEFDSNMYYMIGEKKQIPPKKKTKKEYLNDLKKVLYNC